MWQLELLSRVIPAFGALAKEFIDSDSPDAALSQDAEDCYSDIVNIGQVLSMSQGEWTSGLQDEEVTRLLTALNSRLPTKSKWSFALYPTVIPSQGNEQQFPVLGNLASSIKLHGLGGYEECSELSIQTDETRERYLKLMGRGISIFHKKEINNDEKRDKFLRRVKEANRHLSDVYCKDSSRVDVEEFNLSQHPSHGVKELANTIYDVLERHWNCHCTQPPVREARLSLIRHHQLAPKLPSQETTKQRRTQAKFEVLFPVRKDNVEWKVTDIEVVRNTSLATDKTRGHVINSDICQLLLRSEGFRVNFLAKSDTLWHLTPELDEDIDHHAAMESLHQLLEDGVTMSDFSKLVLCYTLANSMLFLYPGFWLQTAWSCNRVYFLRRSSNQKSSSLTFPYLSVELRQDQKAPKSPINSTQYHHHPVILALGIMFLEIATGDKFVRRSRCQEEWEQSNKDVLQAWEKLRELEKKSDRDRSKRILPALKKAIRSCLKLEPQAVSLTNNLSEEGPIRHYILSCIVQPLALGLRDGYKICLEELHNTLISANDLKSPIESGGQNLGSTLQRSSSIADSLAHDKIRENAQPIISKQQELCLLGDIEEPVDNNKKVMAEKWFKWHNDTLNRIQKALCKPGSSNTNRVKIAILDSGIELSPDNKIWYDPEPKIIYRDWIDQSNEWTDNVGHGTHLAILLRKIAPNAVIHVARVFEKRPKIEISPEIINKAILYAVDDWQVDIIVMSFGFGHKDETLYKAIKYATYKEVLIFAAASNDGKNRPDGIAWPANEPNVICVHSGDGYGNPSTFTPSPRDNMKLMVLGECVSSAWPQKLKEPGDHKHMSGTSCAAPIAAGITAVILDYAKSFLSQEEWENLRRVGSVRRMFEALKDSDNATGYWWIKHWGLFDQARGEPWIQGEIRGYFS